jgi:replicative DNA helicase
VLAIHRDEYYDSETERQGLADIHVLKGKISNVGKVTVRYDKTCTRFDDLAWQR